MKRVLLMDLNYNLNRSFRAKGLKDLCAADGTKTGGVYGLLNTMNVCLRKCAPCQKVIGVWDHGRSKRRLALFPPDYATETGYKANRGILARMTEQEKQEKQQSIEDLKIQQQLVTPLLMQCGVHVVTWPDREGDDVVALLARELSSRFDQVIIGGDDWDFAQCVNEKVALYRPMADQWISLHNYIAELGVPVDWSKFKKAVEGDTSDNIPGVNGTGEKTVQACVQEFVQTVIPDYRQDFYESHQYRTTCPADLTGFFDWTEKHKAKKVQNIGKSREIVKRNIELVDLELELFPPEHVQVLLEGVAKPQMFQEMEVARLLANLNCQKLLENYAYFADPFRKIS